MTAQNALTEAQVSENLVGRILEGDQEAEREMVLRYQRGLGVMLYNRARDHSLASDIAQETWVLVLQKVRDNQLRNKQKLAAFIIQIAKNQLIMRQRKQTKNQMLGEEQAGEIVDSGTTPEKAFANGQLSQCVSRLLDELSVERDKQILQRFYLIGDNKEELCQEFDLTPAHFDRVLYRARERFRSLWEESAGNKYF